MDDGQNRLNPTMGNDTSQKEELEGLENLSLGDYPIDSMLIRNENRSIFEVLRRIDSGNFIMHPDFQRDFIWNENKQSKLVESVLIRIPLPVFYLAEDSQGRMVVVDGLQRLTTFQRFKEGTLKLRLPEQSELNKKSFGDLQIKLQNRFEDCNLILYIIDAKVPERARLDIFERVNGGVPLTRQQMRNSLYNGEGTRFLKTEADSELFKKATGESLNSSTMRDREFINRFCAFSLFPLYEYKEDMDEFLALALRKMNEMKAPDLKMLSDKLHVGLENNLNVFGRHAFRRHDEDQDVRSVLNASLWDVMSTGLSSYSPMEIENNRVSLKQAFYRLMKEDKFIKSITYGPNSSKQVRHRFDAMEKMLKEVFHV